MALVIELKTGESLNIGNGTAVVTLLHKAGQRATLQIDADRSVRVEKVATQIAPIAARNGVMKQR